MAIKYMSNLDLVGKRVLIREDFNVPQADDGSVTDDTRIRAAIPTIEQAVKAGAKVMLMSHIGRPEEGVLDDENSLAPVAKHLSKLLGYEVPLVREWLDGVDLDDGDVVLCENVRCNKGEKKDDEQLAKRMAGICDVYVMDAFGTAHRAQASTHGVARFAPEACAGPLLAGELEALSKALDNPARPMVAIVGGAKVSGKLEVLEALTDKVDQLILGGGIANTFIKAAGYGVGKSLYEEDLVGEAKRLMDKVAAKGGEIPLPEDVRTAKSFDASAAAEVKKLTDVADDDQILDVGPETASKYASALENAGTIVWNGPVGVFEFENFAEGTRAMGEAIARSNGFSLAGGGDTLAAIAKFGLDDRISYISTGGGAFLEFVEGKTLPAVAALEERGR